MTGLVALSACNSNKMKYPQPPVDATVVDTYFGTEVPDPYRPLENDTAAATLEWVKAENAVTDAYMAQIPFRKQVNERLSHLNNYVRTGTPWKNKDGKYYYSENSGLQNQAVVYRCDTLGGEREVFLDPNTLSDNGTVALTGLYPSLDGKYMAYTVSRNGSDWTEIYVMDTATKQLLDDHVEWAKFTDASWDGNGFYYSAYPRPEKGKEYSDANSNHQIYYHALGTPQTDDRLVYEDKDHPLHFHQATVADNGKWLFLTASGEGNGNSMMVRDLTRHRDSAPWVVIEPSQDYEILLVGAKDGKAYLLTNADAPNWRLVAADLKNPSRANWVTLIEEKPAVLTDVRLSGANDLLVSYEQDASSHLYIHDRATGKQKAEIKLPTIGSTDVWASKDNDEVYYDFMSFTYPGAVFAYDKASDQSHLVSSSQIEGIDPADYVTEQVFFTSADGTKVPMFLTYRKGLERDGKNPVFLYGYGGFNISLPPSFRAHRMLWLENGGIYAQVNLRGGSEYGEEWHQAGTKLNKLNVFDDFIGAAEYLIAQGWTSPDYLAINGGSNGGLLVGAVTNMRPDLFKVAVPQVGVMDMMRYHLFTIGWNWASDYGTSADSKEMADYLLAYSPVHTIKNDGTPYPAILVTTADHDDRVVPAHSFKYAATLQASDTGDAPKLIRIESNAGHGGGKPMSKQIEELTDIYSFIFYNMGITPKQPDTTTAE